MTETRAAFHDRVADLERAITMIGREVGEAIPLAATAWLHHDGAKGREIAGQRDLWTERAKLVEQGSYELIATQQPMAGDLRRIISLIRLSEEVSRSGALVSHVALAAEFDRDPSGYGDTSRSLVAEMASTASALWREALDSYESGDAVSASSVASQDDRLDSLHRSLLDELVRKPNTNVACAVDLALLGRYLERLGDHAVDIAARAGFVVTGEMP